MESSNILLNSNSWPIIIVFLIGYALITFEHLTKISKTAIALLMGIICWVLLFYTEACPGKTNTTCFLEHLAGISQIILFLLGALIIVEIINIHHGFKVISDYIHLSSKKKMLWVLGILAFWLSSVLDNLTTTIVMITLLSKLTHKSEDRLIVGGGIVIAANAGGAWTPIGDVTTTMLWIGGQLSTGAIMRDLFLPSVTCLIVSLFVLSWQLKGDFVHASREQEQDIEPNGKTVLFLGIGSLVLVPVFKTITGLPPFMGILFSVGALWVIIEWMHRNYPERQHLQITQALKRVDLSTILFFLGILLCIATLDVAHILEATASWLDEKVQSDVMVATVIGLVSAIVDNVPLVAASMGMYDLASHPQNSIFWELIAYCAGTGGSILVIGSAAGVVYMGLEKVDFLWYVKRISLAALVGYFSGIGIYLLQSLIIH